MFDTVLGLPVHALVVHAVVVLLPAAALGAVAIALVSRWRKRYGLLVALVATVAVASVPVAVNSGQRLSGRIQAGGVVARQIRDHREIGELVIWPALAMWLFTVVLILLSRRGRKGRFVTGVSALTVVAALAAGAVVARAGHLGSTAVWACTIGSSACR